MMQAPGFQVTRSGDTFYATAPGFRKKDDESRRRDWAQRAAANEASLDIEREAREIDRAILMRAEAKYDKIAVSFLIRTRVFAPCV